MAVDDQDDNQRYGRLPDPSMRTWIHPSEMAAAAKQAALIEKRHRLRSGLTIAAGVLIGAGGVLIGVASIRASSDSIAMIGSSSTIASLTAAAALSTPSIAASPATSPTSTQADNALTQQVATTTYVVSTSMPNGMVAISGIGSTDPVISSGISQDGHVLASASALAGRQQFIIWNGSESVPGHVVGVDPFSDLAVLAYDESVVLPELSQSRFLAAPTSGNEIQILGLDGNGNMVGEEGSIISLRHRTHSANGQEILGSIRTTALLGNIKPGALLTNIDGHPIGLVVNSSDHLISAIPLEEALAIAQNLIKKGWATDAWLGVSCTSTEHGLSVDCVSLVSLAAFGGLGQGDIVVSLNGVEMTTVADLIDELRLYDPTNSIELILERDSEMVLVEIELGERVAILLDDH